MFANCSIPNATYDSPLKAFMTLRDKRFAAKCVLSNRFIQNSIDLIGADGLFKRNTPKQPKKRGAKRNVKKIAVHRAKFNEVADKFVTLVGASDTSKYH